MNSIKLFVLLFLFFVSTAFTFFHHGWANYDQEKRLDYTGVIQQATYENPHATAKVNFKDKTWTVVLAPTSRMQERGVTAAMLQKGTTIRVIGYPHREVKDEMRAETIFIQGKEYQMRR
ncbi:hypothetical protein AAE02nite_01390 [Adhaeribacter aerolatus]|uniref:DUF5666 domain-containing protein n=1 Tax=Adhaeribacter aerolatus TaxID=670289 RepID=A0A512ARZ1_9BACT|nr:DUF6152 family protein [Adhaeribacter aerolatus]GEO02475.1 hypothetical protein AAE02nite_01390 [Adhaeribacter aerolatus]